MCLQTRESIRLATVTGLCRGRTERAAPDSALETGHPTQTPCDQLLYTAGVAIPSSVRLTQMQHLHTDGEHSTGPTGAEGVDFPEIEFRKNAEPGQPQGRRRWSEQYEEKASCQHRGRLYRVEQAVGINETI